MADDDEAKWRTEFERFGESQVQESLRAGFFPEPKRQFAFRWLGDRAREKSLRETQTFRYVRWTLWAAIVAAIIGIVGIVVTLVH